MKTWNNTKNKEPFEVWNHWKIKTSIRVLLVPTKILFFHYYRKRYYINYDKKRNQKGIVLQTLQL